MYSDLHVVASRACSRFDARRQFSGYLSSREWRSMWSINSEERLCRTRSKAARAGCRTNYNRFLEWITIAGLVAAFAILLNKNLTCCIERCKVAFFPYDVFTLAMNDFLLVTPLSKRFDSQSLGDGFRTRSIRMRSDKEEPTCRVLFRQSLHAVV